MSRIAKNPVELPKGVEVDITGALLTAKGPLGSLEREIPSCVTLTREDTSIKVSASEESAHARAMSGTIRPLISNMVNGVATGFEKRLTLHGVGYRAQIEGDKLNLSLGFSHRVLKHIPAGITATTPTPTEIVIKGHDKQVVGQISAEIRSFRPPEPYKGKGIRYENEHVILKEAKKK